MPKIINLNHNAPTLTIFPLSLFSVSLMCVALAICSLTTFTRATHLSIDSREHTNNQPYPSRAPIGKKIVFIVGIGRCGSSCLTGVLHLMGLPLGDNLLKPNILNPTGFFENLDMLNLNRKILKQVGVEYLEGKKSRFIQWRKEPRSIEFKNMIKNQLSLTFKNQTFFGLKDPRLSVLLPLYIDAARELGYQTQTVIIIRNPEESMASWQSAGSFARLSTEEILKKFTIYLTSMLANLKTVSDCLVVQYEDLLENSAQEVTRISRFIPELKADINTRNAISGFINKSLNHHAS